MIKEALLSTGFALIVGAGILVRLAADIAAIAEADQRNKPKTCRKVG